MNIGSMVNERGNIPIEVARINNKKECGFMLHRAHLIVTLTTSNLLSFDNKK